MTTHPDPGSDRLRIVEPHHPRLMVYREEVSGHYLCRVETRRGVTWGVGETKETAALRALELLARRPR
jgi:hypothetical protein